MKRAGRKAVIHASLIVPDANGAFVVRESCAMLYGTHIEGILPMEDFRPDMADEIYDAQGKYVSPGFIDVHIHGGVGTIRWTRQTRRCLPCGHSRQSRG